MRFIVTRRRTPVVDMANNNNNNNNNNGLAVVIFSPLSRDKNSRIAFSVRTLSNEQSSESGGDKTKRAMDERVDKIKSNEVAKEAREEATKEIKEDEGEKKSAIIRQDESDETHFHLDHHQKQRSQAKKKSNNAKTKTIMNPDSSSSKRANRTAFSRKSSTCHKFRELSKMIRNVSRISSFIETKISPQIQHRRRMSPRFAAKRRAAAAAAALLLPKLSEMKEKFFDCKNLAKLQSYLAEIGIDAEQMKRFPASPIERDLSIVEAAAEEEEEEEEEGFLYKKKLACSRKLLFEDNDDDHNDNNDNSNNNNNDENNNNNNNLVIPILANVQNETHCKTQLALIETTNYRPTTTTTIIPAYYKRSYLAKRSDDCDRHSEISTLQLPRHFRELIRTFKLLDEIVAVHHKRQQICTFDAVKRAIERITRQAFTTEILAKILTVICGGNRDDSIRASWFRLSHEIVDRRTQLTIVPLYEHIRSSSSSSSSICVNSISTLIERVREFHLALLEHTKREHLRFLAEMRLTLDSIVIVRWHPSFVLDSVRDIVPDISLLPADPGVCAKSNNRPNEDDDDDRNPELIVQSDREIDSFAGRVESGRLKGVKMDLLQKIRIKEISQQQQHQQTSKSAPNCAISAERDLFAIAALPQIVRVLDQYYRNSGVRSHSIDRVIRAISCSVKCSESLARKRLDDLLAIVDRIWNENHHQKHQDNRDPNPDQDSESPDPDQVARANRPWIVRRTSSLGDTYLVVEGNYRLANELQASILNRVKQLSVPHPR